MSNGFYLNIFFVLTKTIFPAWSTTAWHMLCRLCSATKPIGAFFFYPLRLSDQNLAHKTSKTDVKLNMHPAMWIHFTRNVELLERIKIQMSKNTKIICYFLITLILDKFINYLLTYTVLVNASNGVQIISMFVVDLIIAFVCYWKIVADKNTPHDQD